MQMMRRTCVTLFEAALIASPSQLPLLKNREMTVYRCSATSVTATLSRLWPFSTPASLVILFVVVRRLAT